MWWKKTPSQLCSNIKNINTFKSKHSNEAYQTKETSSWNSKKVVYLIERKVCGKQFNGSTVTKFCARANNCISTHCIFRKEQKLSNQARKQTRFHKYYLQNDHNGSFGWEITKGKKNCTGTIKLKTLMNVMFTLRILW